MVEDLVLSSESYIDAVIKTCDICNLELAIGARMLSQPIIEKIQKEGEVFNLLPRMSTLPV